MSAATGRGDKDEPPLYVQIAPDVARLASEGIGRNRIADQLDVAQSTVTKAAQHAGIDLDAAPAAATAGRARQAEHARLELAGLAHQIAVKAGNKLVDALDRDDLDAIRPLSVAFGVSADKEIALARHLPAGDATTGDTLLDRLATGFSEWAAHVEQLDHHQTADDAQGGTA
ncbi:hypothetical protein NCCP2495_16860 [Dietzia sp. NCCP-2495]|uniref:hypothetical protein n=1 Tax=Dietzia sp. NCCP-2495 TaxID=2934675 RepID=UPI002231C454|nr:hypothetical protein [Dietzia sp. NCCP-2495]GLB63807.1 hypothetical protein NCCP2495_16860 [Dietzia sp. NCCP-2495]